MPISSKALAVPFEELRTSLLVETLEECPVASGAGIQNLGGGREKFGGGTPGGGNPGGSILGGSTAGGGSLEDGGTLSGC